MVKQNINYRKLRITTSTNGVPKGTDASEKDQVAGSMPKPGFFSDNSSRTKKKHLVFSNCLIMLNQVDQSKLIGVDWLPSSRELREAWEPEFINTISLFFTNGKG